MNIQMYLLPFDFYSSWRNGIVFFSRVNEVSVVDNKTWTTDDPTLIINF